MKYSTLELLACPICYGELELRDTQSNGTIEHGKLHCACCDRNYPIVAGIPRFIQVEELTGLNRRFARLHDVVSHVYQPASQFVQFFARWVGMTRREVTDRLEMKGGRVLEVSIGPGVNLPYLIGAAGVDEVLGLDISLGQLQNCLSYCRRKGWAVDLFLAQAEELPFHKDAFAGVLHIGGINFFSNKAKAIQEMIRVAKPGAKIIIVDETEGLARKYDRWVPGFARAFEDKREAVNPPIDLLPSEMEDVRLSTVWRGACYCLEFRKPPKSRRRPRSRLE